MITQTDAGPQKLCWLSCITSRATGLPWLASSAQILIIYRCDVDRCQVLSVPLGGKTAMAASTTPIMEAGMPGLIGEPCCVRKRNETDNLHRRHEAVVYNGATDTPAPPSTPILRFVNTWKNLTTSGSGFQPYSNIYHRSRHEPLVLIGLAWESSSSCNPTSITGNYGGQTITTINKAIDSTNRQGQWMGYVGEAGIGSKNERYHYADLQRLHPYPYTHDISSYISGGVPVNSACFCNC